MADPGTSTTVFGDRRARPWWRLHVVTIVVLVVGVLATGTIAYATSVVHRRNEHRLLEQRAKEASLILTSALPNIVSTMNFAASLAEATEVDPDLMKSILGPLVGPKQGQPFDSLTIWRADGTGKPLFQLGSRPHARDDAGQQIGSFVRRASKPALRLRRLLNAPQPAIGYSFASFLPNRKYVAYAENALPTDRTQRRQTSDAFEGVDYALYLDNTTSKNFLTASTSDLPLGGHTEQAFAPFGDGRLVLVLSAREELGGTLLSRLPWIIAVSGVVLTLVFAFFAERLTRRREQAEDLATENDRLYRDQRSVAETLQRSLLPDELPQLPDIHFASRYEPGVRGIEIGGDWYDVVEIDEDRVLLVVGDVSGRGLEAGSVMASIRYAIRAHATQGDGPGDILDKLGSVLQVGRDRHFATVLCIEVHRSDRSLRMANAGHPRPLLLRGADAEFLAPPVGPPVGVQRGQRYEEAMAMVEPGSTLLLYTDGLIERRGEPIDDGMERLRVTAGALGSEELGGFLDDVLDRMVGDERADDTALLGARWV